MAYRGTPIVRGEKSNAVLQIQRALGIEQTGLFGPTTEQVVEEFQADHGLQPDGVVGPATWGYIFGMPPGDLAAEIVRLAGNNVGVHEQPRGSNRGPVIDKWNLDAGNKLGDPWCVAFAYGMVKGAAFLKKITVPLIRTGSSSAMYRWAVDNNRLGSAPQIGDIFLLKGGETGHRHAGIVTGRLIGGRFATIEGNTNDEGTTEGYEVCRRSRYLPTCNIVRMG